MTTTNENTSYNVLAAADLSAQASRYRAISLNGVLLPGLAAGATGQVAGILTSSSRSGELATYVRQGITKVVAGAAVTTLGYPVMTGSGGYMFAAASGGIYCGRALEVAASGDLFQVNVDFVGFPTFTGV